MSEQSKRRIGSTGAIIIAALIVSAGVVYAVSPYGVGATRTVTSTETSIIAPTSISLYKVTFNESGACGGVYVDKWSITIGNITIGQPSGVALPITKEDPSVFSGTFKDISQITFTLPDGSYRYYISGGLSAANGLLNGTVTVDGSDVVVPVEGPYISCVG
jgi:hypothetical protein